MKYVRCDSHCKYPAYTQDEVYNKEEVYTKEEIDTKNDKKFDSSNIYTLEIKETYPSGVDFKEFNYPSGFSWSNCVVISAMIKGNDGSEDYYRYISLNKKTIDGSSGEFVEPNVFLNESKIRVYAYNETSSNKEYNFKIVLLKVS